MALVVADRVQQTGTANTTVSFTLSGSVTGYQSFAVIGNTNTTYYSATDASGNWEVGIGTYSTTGPTLTRTAILSSSNSGNAVTFVDTVSVFVTYPSGKSVTQEQNTAAPTYPGSTSTWYETDTGDLKVYYNDGTSTQWVSAALGLSGLSFSSFDGGVAAVTSYSAVSVINGGAST